MKLAYLAGPIDQAGTREELWTDRRRAKALLVQAGFAVYDPSEAFSAKPETFRAADDPRIGEVNWKALWSADAVMAMLPVGVPTIGTPMEVLNAAQNGQPVAVIGAEGSWQVAGMENGRLQRFTMDDVAKAVFWLMQTSDSAGGALLSGVKPWKLVGESEAMMPTRSYEGDAGFDLYVLEETHIEPGEFVDVKSGIRCEFPEGVWGMIVGRSSTLRKRNLLVNTGIIDQGYRGELFSGVKNLGGEAVTLWPGERVAQLIPFPQTSKWLAPIEVETLGMSDRGDAGFGSTGGFSGKVSGR